MVIVWGDTLVYNTIGQHKIIVLYTFCKLSLYAGILSVNMVFQRQVIPHTINTSVISSFDKKMQINLIWTHSLVVLN